LGHIHCDVVAAAKALSPVLDDFRDSAHRNGYDPMLVEAMVRPEPVIYLVIGAQSPMTALGTMITSSQERAISFPFLSNGS